MKTTKKQQELLFLAFSEYLPYDLLLKTPHGSCTFTTLNEYCINGDHEDFYSFEVGEELECRPILNPFSDISKHIDELNKFCDFKRVESYEFLNERLVFNTWVCSHVISKKITEYPSPEYYPKFVFDFFISKHIDLRNLIPKDLAIIKTSNT